MEEAVEGHWDNLASDVCSEVPKPAGPPYMMYTYNSSAKAVKDQHYGEGISEHHPILLFNVKLTRVQDNFNYRTAPLSDEEESPPMKAFHR